MITPEILTALQEAEAAMAPGPWVKAFGDAIFPPDSSMPVAWTRDMGPDAAGIVLLRNNAAALLDAARREARLREAGWSALRGFHLAAREEHRHPVEQCPDRRFAELATALAPTDSAGSPE